MSSVTRQEPARKPFNGILRYVTGILLITVAIFALSLKIYLATPYPARRLSGLLTAYLHQPVTVQSLVMAGSRLQLQGVSIADPAGFPGGRLLTVKSLAITPSWGLMLMGRRVFDLIELEGLQIDLHKNGAGVWNFSGLRQLSAKPGGKETFVRRLAIRDGSIRVEGEGVREVSFTILDLATKGATAASIALTFADEAQNRYTMTGKGRGGSDPALELNLKAPSLSLARLAPLLKLKDAEFLAKARVELQLWVALGKGRLQTRGEAGFSGVGGGAGLEPLSGRCNFKASYSQESDQASLESLDLAVGDFLALHGSGTAKGLKKERRFQLAFKSGELDLGRLPALLPAVAGRGILLTGRLGIAELQLAGSPREGITEISGGAQLREFSLQKGGRSWVSGLSGNVVVAKQGAGIGVRGRLSSRGGTGAALALLKAPFALWLSPSLKLRQARLNLDRARLLGLDLTGGAGYDLAATEPFRVSVQGSSSNHAALASLLEKSGLRLDSGTFVGAVRAAGKDHRNFGATVELRVSEARGNRGESAVSLKQGATVARVSRSGGRSIISGNCELMGLAVGGKSGQVRLDYKMADKLLTLENGVITLDGTIITLARLTAAQPRGESRRDGVYYPLSMEFSNGRITRRSVAGRAISGRLDGYLVRSGVLKWLEGSARLAVGELAWQGKPVAAPLALVTFNRAGARAVIDGTLLGGKLTGDVAFNPFSVAVGTNFSLGIKGADLVSTTAFLPPKSEVKVAEGLADGTLTGRYSGRDGLSAGVAATGGGVTVVRRGKNLVSRAGITLSGTIAGQKISINKASVTAGEDLSFSADGQLENAFSESRQGRFNFVAREAPLNSYVDAFINSMPRYLQESAVAGSLAANGTLSLGNGRRLLQGGLNFGRISLDSAGKGLAIHDLHGNFPFSIDLSGGATVVPTRAVDFTRENYQQLYRQLDRQPEKSQVVTIGSIALGRAELGPLTLQVKAGNGLTEIAALRTSLYDGTMLGAGSMYMKKRINYRGDLLLGGLSLKELCNHFPAINGYISGRVNGIVSLYGEAGGISGQYGFVDLWANEAKGEKMVVSREFLQRLGGKKLSGIFFRKDIPYDRAEISALLEQGYLTFDTLDLIHTNIFGVRDLNVSIAPAQNRIALDHLIESIKQASMSGKAASGQRKAPAEAAPATEFKWEE